VNHHSTNEEEEVVLVAEALVIAVEEEDNSDINGGNVDNFPPFRRPSRRSWRAATSMARMLISSSPFR
jgi:hypothetical protein